MNGEPAQFDIEPGEARRILVVLPTWVGDFVMATPTLRAIRDRFSSSAITFLCVANLADMVASGDWMDDVVTYPGRNGRNGLRANWRLIAALRKRRFDLAVLLPNSFRSALIARLSGARRRVGYVRDGRGLLLTDGLRVPGSSGRVEPSPICGYYGRIARCLGCGEPGDALRLFTDAGSDKSVAQRLDDWGASDRGPLVVMAPGAAFGASKLWAPGRYAQLADRLIDDRNASVVVSVGPGEEHIARVISRESHRGVLVPKDPRLSLSELKSLIRRCDLLVVNDTGPRHIGKAFGVPVVTIFGPTHQAWTDTDYALERKIQIPVDCGPCQKKVCPFEHHDCMAGVSVDMVYAQCSALLRLRAAAV